MKREDAATQIENGIRDLYESLAAGRSESLAQYLSVMSRFHKYSWGNQLLIWQQMPEATRVAGYGTWKSLGRQVMKGQSGIGILAPIRRKVSSDDGEDTSAIFGFKLAFVFDVSQTEGEDLPEFARSQGDVGDNQVRIEAVIKNADIVLVEDDLPHNANGASSGGTITLRSGLLPAERLRVSVHEFAHELLNHLERRHSTTHTQRETEAEAIAFVVTNALGIDGLDRSADYIHLHGGGVESFSESLEVIQKTSTDILSRMENVKLGCNHTIHLEPDSTWTAVATDSGIKYECSVCSKFYGYAPPEVDELPAEEPQLELRIGRADYEERREGRIERLEDKAEKARAESNSTHEQARKMADVIPFGQPMMPGHHSYKRDRNYRDRIHNKFRKSFELESKAEHLESLAHSAAGNDAISSDDPEALVKLREKLASLEQRQTYMKKLNAAWRKAGKPNSQAIDGWHNVADIMGVDRSKMERLATAMSGVDHFSHDRDRAPAAPYELTNNNANIRRVRQRIKELEREGAITESTEVKHDGICRVVENVDLNRVQLIFPGKPSDEVRAALKSRGFRWARSEKAWQRQLNNAGRYAAKAVVEELQKQKGAEHEREADAERSDIA